MRLLITAFEPFGGELENASLALLQSLPNRIGTVELIKETLPVVFCKDRLFAAIEEARPNAVLCMGQAGGAKELRFERFALNIKDTLSPDNSGLICKDIPISLNGASVLESTLPLKEMTLAANTAVLPAKISYHAGTYVCNYMFYRLMEYTRRKIPAGFLHVPLTDTQQVRHPQLFSAPLSDMVNAVLRAIHVL